MCQEAFPRGGSSDQINKVGDNEAMGTDVQGHRSRPEGSNAGHTPDSIRPDKLTWPLRVSAVGPALPSPASFPQASHSWEEAAAINPRRQRWLSWAWLQGPGCGRHLGTGLGERAGVVGLGEGLCEAGEDTVASGPQASEPHLLSLKLGILGFPLWPLQRVPQD